MGVIGMSVIVAAVMFIGIRVAGRSETSLGAYGATVAAMAVSIVVWMLLSEPLNLTDSTSAMTALPVELIALSAIAILHFKKNSRR